MTLSFTASKDFITPVKGFIKIQGPLQALQEGMHLKTKSLSWMLALVSFLLEIPNLVLRNLHFLGLCIDTVMF